MRPFLFLLFLIGASVTYGTDPRADGLVVATWNLEWFFDNQKFDNYSSLAKEMSAPDRARWDWRRDAVAASIASLAPDIVALQEVESRKVMNYLNSTLKGKHNLAYRVICIDGAEPFTEQDVAMLYHDRMWLRRTALNGQTRQMYGTKEYYNVFKHIEAEFEIGEADDPVVVTVINLHMRARPEKADVRVRQARLVHHWIADRAAAGENIIVLGDFNTEQAAGDLAGDSDLGIICGKHTPNPEDDLVDLHDRLPADQRQTHLLEGKSFDRICVSRAVMEDDPTRKDLVFRGVERPRHWAVKGDGPDEQEAHWNAYWELDEHQRDLSDHWPVVAKFDIK